MKKSVVLLFIVGIVLSIGSLAHAVPAVDVVQSPTGYFVPDDALKYSSPYYRWNGEDWGWTHNAIVTPFTTATLSISAFDVDNYGGTFDEYDQIFAYDGGTASWIQLGVLAGASDIWSYTTFNVDASLFDDIASGLQVRMVIDNGDDGWAVTLAKSVISVDEGIIPNPQPGAVPEPSTFLLLGAGLAGLGLASRKFRKS